MKACGESGRGKFVHADMESPSTSDVGQAGPSWGGGREVGRTFPKRRFSWGDW